MPPAALLAPIVIPLAAAGVIILCGLLGFNVGRAAAGLGAAGSAISLLVLWLAVRATQELNIGALGYGSAVELRVDAVAFAFGLIVVLPAAVLLCLQLRTWQEAALASLGLAAAMAAVEAGGLVLTALAGGTAAMLAAVQLDTEEPNTPRPHWSMLLAAWLLLSLVGVVLQVRGGTDAYAAVPVANFTAPIFVVLAAAALLTSGLAPWRMWPSQLFMRASPRAAGMTVITLFPLGFYLLARAYELGDGRYPAPGFHVGLAALGALVAIAAAVRAQAAATQREFLGEAVMGFGGFALMTTSLGTPLGLTTGMITLATAAALVVCIALLPGTSGAHSLVAIAAAVGLPPGLVFGTRVIGIESTFEAGDYLGLIGLAGAVAWALWLVGGARALGLPSAADGAGIPKGFPRIALAVAALTLIAGPGLAALQVTFANPAQADVMANQIGPTSSLQSVVTVSTVLPSLTLFVPLLLVAALAFLLTGTDFGGGVPKLALFASPGRVLAGRVREALGDAAVPAEYRSLVNLRAIEAAAVAGRPVLWLGALVALAFAVTR